ncbi:hypothetical protein HK100_004583 [Physocladia obscura]|uniref:Uncharacterized protein n=1 Tax=Physocladia obscura TaxID=109957 RepID=A0AAD5XDS4_9FUNG|nr:hypothetical protein HK100_004583 [Physocladia obscura]
MYIISDNRTHIGSEVKYVSNEALSTKGLAAKKRISNFQFGRFGKMHLPAITSLLLLLFALKATALGLYEPADGKVIWGAWVDSAVAGTPNSYLTAGGDSPTLFDKRLGQNAGVFHLSQNLPLSISPFDGSQLTANLSLIEATKTDAILFLTVYPTSFSDYTDEDIAALAYQLSNITDPTLSSRRVLLR